MSPVLFTALVLVHSPAYACWPSPALVNDWAPGSEQTDVPVDAVVRAYAGSGYIGWDGTPAVEVSIGGALVEGTLSVESVELDLTQEAGVLTFTPSEPLPAGSRIDVDVYDVGDSHDGPLDASWSFTTGERLVEEPVAAPTLSITSFTQSYHSGEWDDCSVASEVALQVEVELAAADPDGLSLIRAYEVEDGERSSAPAYTWGPVGASTALSLTATWSAGDEAVGERCYTVVQVDGAGRESDPSAVECAGADPAGGELPETDTGEVSDKTAACAGCATGARGLELSGLALAIGLALGRRSGRG